METLIRVMLAVFLVGLIVMAIVFFSIFGLLPAERLTKVLQSDNSTSTRPTVIVSTTTIVERIIERRNGDEDEVSEPPSEPTQPSPPQEPTQPSPPRDEPQEPQEPQEPTQPSGPTEQDLPPAVFNTSGAITEVGSDYFLIDSDGSHMELIPASGVVPIKVFVESDTNLLNEDNDSISISDFSVGDRVSLEAPSNIKNETEFSASNIRISE